jgi:hypothetical protein
MSCVVTQDKLLLSYLRCIIMKNSKCFGTFLVGLALTAFAGMACAQSKAVTLDGFGDQAHAWLKTHPDVKKCAWAMSDRNQQEKTKNGIGSGTSSSEFGEFIGKCAKQTSTGSVVVATKKMKGDEVDENPNAKPNGSAETRNKQSGKAWQDNNGIMHFPDGSASSGSID